MTGRNPVLLFDGECGLCHACVRWLLRIDRRGRLRFAPLQGDVARGFLRMQGLPETDFSTLVFVPDWERPEPGGYLLRTEGVCAALAATGDFGRELSNLRALPAAWRDAAYKLVARSRYALLGEYRPTPLPNPDWAGRFL